MLTVLFFQHLILYHFLLTFKVFDEYLSFKLIFSYNVSLLLRFFFLVFVFWNLTMMCLGGDLFEFIPFGVCSKMGIFQPLFFRILFQSTFFLLSFLDSININDRDCVSVPYDCETLFTFFFSLLIVFHIRGSLSFLSPNSMNLSCLLPSAVEPSHWVFTFVVLWGSKISVWFPLYNFYYFAETVFFFAETLFFICFQHVYSSYSYMERFYDNYFKTLVR